MIRDTLLEHPLVYLAWQAPFIEDKLRPVFQHNDMAQVRKILDVGCGPGTNAAHFRGLDYLGLDINPKYIRRAQQRYGPRAKRSTTGAGTNVSFEEAHTVSAIRRILAILIIQTRRSRSS